MGARCALLCSFTAVGANYREAEEAVLEGDDGGFSRLVGAVARVLAEQFAMAGEVDDQHAPVIPADGGALDDGDVR